MLRWLLVAVALAMPVSAGLLQVWINQDAVQAGYDLSKEVKRRRQLHEQVRRLELELTAQRSPERLRVLAKQLGLTPPAAGRVIGAGGTRGP